jgi:hypothetical protein
MGLTMGIRTEAMWARIYFFLLCGELREIGLKRSPEMVEIQVAPE